MSLTGTGAISGCEAVSGVLLVSPDEQLRRDVKTRVDAERWRMTEAVSGAHALDQLEANDFDLLLLDPVLPDLDQTEFQSMVRAQFPRVKILELDRESGLPLQVVPANPAYAMEAFKASAQKMGKNRTSSAAIQLQDLEEDEECRPLPGMIGNSAAARRVYRMTRLVAGRDTTVLISGPSGTGKDLVAQAIHTLSPRRTNPFVVVNCAAIPEPLLEAELFGYTKGAFTGAVQSHVGRIHAAHNGTLFLDEIGDMPLGLQSKLLRFLEQGEVQRLGSADNFRVDVRVVAATNSNLRKLVQEGKFRDDLFYRLAIFPIEIPPLRERMEDLPALVASFVNRFSPHRYTLSPEAMLVLLQHDWPGNIRCLRNVVERATILAQREHQILAKHIVI
jgi:DNA-binding NtrC family response regulator